jgi:hypothetical protein
VSQRSCMLRMRRKCLRTKGVQSVNTAKSMSKRMGIYFLEITSLQAGAPFTPWDSLRNLFVATSKTFEETLKKSRLLDLVCRMWILWCIL